MTSMPILPGWIAFLPILLSLVSFSIFLGDVKRGPDGGVRSLTRTGVLLASLGFIGLVGSILLVVANLQSESLRAKRESALLDQVLSLKNANQMLLESQAKLLNTNEQLLALSSTLNERAVAQQSQIDQLQEEVSSAHATTLEQAQIAEANAAALRERMEQLRRTSTEQADSARKSAEIAADREAHERRCVWAKQFMPVDIQRMVYGCF